MTDTAQQAESSFRPIYPATIVPGEVQRLVNANDKPYLLIKGSQVTPKKSGETRTRTVMVFGKSVDSIGDRLVEGVAVDLAVQNDGGTVKIIGEILAPKTAQG